MLIKINLYKYFFITILFSLFLGYFFKSGIIAYGPIIILGIFVIAYEFNSINKINKSFIISSILWLPYVIWASFVYISNPFEKYLSTYLLTIFILPLVTITYFRILYNKNKYYNYKFIYNSLFTFIIFQFIICLGQISKYTFGIGLPVSELYSEIKMVTGTFTNSNDLGAVVLAILFVVLGLEKYYFKHQKYLFWLLVFVLIIISGSRSAIVLALVFFTLNRISSINKFITFIFTGFIFIILVYLIMLYLENEVIMRLLYRIKSLINIFQNGISFDNSMTVRISSYLHYLSKLPELGLGSGELNNYFKYSEGAVFNSQELLFQNPHSFVVELGYWLGWPGLILFFIPFINLLKYSKRKVQVLIVFFIVGMIPSSIIGNMTFFLIIVLSFFDYQQPLHAKNVNSLRNKI